MKLPGDCASKTKGFTFIELLLVLGIFSLLVVITLPLAVNFYNSRQLDVHEQGIVQSLRKAQLKSINQELNSSFGVYLDSDQYVLFKGNSYLGRDIAFDEVTPLPGSLSLSGLGEVAFSKLEGLPSATGDIILTSSSRTATININEKGRVNY